MLKHPSTLRRELARLALQQKRKDLRTDAFYAGKMHGAQIALEWALSNDKLAPSNTLPKQA